ncbi:MAG: histidine kinase, partial [Bifidobacteriaceae bacterium]|nr:histidine kinase [Bifidobacteriaceae bacterium]
REASAAGPAARPEPGLPRPGRFRRFADAHPVLMDVAVAGLFFALSGLAWVGSAGEEAGGAGGGWLTPPLAEASPAVIGQVYAVYWALAVAALIAWRRRHPVWLLAGALALDSAMWAALGRPDQWVVFFALFAVAQRASARAAWIGLGVTCADLVAMAYLAGDNTGDGVNELVAIALYTALVSVFVHLGNRRRYVAALVDSAEHLALERDQRAQIAVATERARIAREMHDVVAHSVAVMVTLSDGAQAAIDRQPERAREAMAMVSQTGRQAVADMRRLLAVLRADTDRAPQPGADDLVPLVDSFKRSGLPVTLELAASIPDDPALGLTIYRIVQESLTNVLRHGGAPDWTRVNITEPQAGALRVAVVNGPPTLDAEQAGGKWEGSGQGLVGMAQRVEVFGGSLEAGPTPEGGWSVAATLKEER